MGDFDKNKTPDAAAEKKKLLLVGVLGAVLLGVVSIHFMRGGPQSASASVVAEPGESSAALQASEETPSQAQAALADDPTASLLRETSTSSDPALQKTPHNPFVISAEWRSELVHPTEVRVVHNQPTYVPPSPQAVSIENFKLSGILHQNNALCAIVNGRIVTAGMTLDDVKIVEIAPDHVTLQRADAPTGPKSQLTIEPKL